MKKTSFIALITLSSLVLSQAAVFADEGTAPVDSTASVVVTPTQPSSTPSETNPTPTSHPLTIQQHLLYLIRRLVQTQQLQVLQNQVKMMRYYQKILLQL